MSSLQELMGQSQAPLSSLLVEEGNASPLPEATARNRAATVAIQSGNPESVIPDFQSAMSDNAMGSDTTVEELTSSMRERDQESDFQTLMSVLSDPNTPTEVKPALVEAFQTSERLSDPSNRLADQALIAPSQGENIEQEAVRLSVTEILGDYMRHKSQIQGLVNQFVLDNPGTGPQGSLDMASVMIPGADSATNVAVTKDIYEALGMPYAPGNKIRDFLAPGFSALDVREHFNKLSPDDQITAVSKILDSIRNNNAIMAGGENQVRAMQMLNRFLVGDYDTSDAVVDSLFTALDMIGIGASLRAGTRAVRGVRSTQEAVDIAEEARATRTSPGPSPGLTETRMPEARVSARGSEIQALEDEYASLLGETQSALDQGSVRNLREQLNQIVQEAESVKKAGLKSRTKQLQSDGLQAKDARTAAKKEQTDILAELKAREEAIQNKLRINTQTEKAGQKLADVEKRLNAARKDTSTVPARLNPIQDAISRISRNSPFYIDNPASAGATLSDLNPEKGRALIKTIFDSNSDEVAMAAFGMTRQDALVSQTFPQVATESGIVRAKIPNSQASIEVPVDEGGIRFSDVEREILVSNVAKDFKNANGLTVHDPESSFFVTPDGGQIKISAMYGTSEGGFLRAEDAVDQAKLALRQYGIKEEDIIVMRKNGIDYEPVELKDVQGIDGDYKIRIDTVVDQTVEMMGDGWEAFDVKRNFMDRFAITMFSGAGSVNRMLTDAASNLHPNLAGSFSVASDVAVTLEKSLLKYAEAFSKRYNNLEKGRKNKVWDYLLEANSKGIPHSISKLRADGFTDIEIDALSDFRNFWDMHFQLENLDIVRTLRNRGFQVLENSLGDKLFAKAVPKNQNYNKVYDPSTGDIKYLAKDEMDVLYDEGGTIALLKNPMDIDGSTAEYMISRNNTSEYLRMIRDDDKVLNYREGYFQVNYKAPQYIRKVNADGSMRAVAVRGDKLAAETEAKRLSSTTGDQYIVTGDDRNIDRSFEDMWDVNQVSGRIAQRRRGQRLEGAEGLNVVDGKEFVENPIDSSIRAARSIAGRTVSRPALETAKARALKQYGHMLPKDQYGRPVYPSDPKNIKLVGEYTTSELADARTTFEAINRFENGYINTIDEASKALMNTVANAFGALNVKTGGGFGAVERGARSLSEGRGISSVARGTAFQAYIALNPIRNWIMQPAQVLRTVGYSPQAWLSGDMTRYMAGISNHLLGLKVPPDVAEMIAGLNSTGMLDAVDRSNMVRGALLEASESSGKMMRGLSKIPETTRKYGFDIGEKLNLFGHYSAVWSKYKRSGANMKDKRVLAEIHNEARAISGEMNRAGDFAYNENLLSTVFQFAQVPHKFLLTATNRKIDRATRARMMAGDLLLWGIPGTYGLTQLIGEDILPDDPELRDWIISGTASAAINWAVQQTTGDDTGIDFSTLAPYNLGGFGDIFEAVMDEGIGTMIENSPSGQLFLKDSGRLGQAYRSLFRHFSPIAEGLETPETILDTVNQFAKISSGWNNLTKSYVAAQTGMVMDKYNVPVDTSVTFTEAVALAFGFQTMDTRKHYDTIGRLIDNAEAQKQVAKDISNSIFEMYANAYQGSNALDPQAITRVSGALLTLTAKNPQLAKEVNNFNRMRLRDPNDGTFKSIQKAIQMPTAEMAETMVRDSALPEAKKKQLLEFLAARNQLIKEEE